MDTLKSTCRKISEDGYSTLNVMKKHKGMHHIKHRVVTWVTHPIECNISS